MTARAMVTGISDEHVIEDGISMYVRFIVVDDESYPRQQPVVSAVSVVMDPSRDSAEWSDRVRTAIIEASAEMPDPFKIAPENVAVPSL